MLRHAEGGKGGNSAGLRSGRLPARRASPILRPLLFTEAKQDAEARASVGEYAPVHVIASREAAWRSRNWIASIDQVAMSPGHG
jgi:hypothetical protein